MAALTTLGISLLGFLGMGILFPFFARLLSMLQETRAPAGFTRTKFKTSSAATTSHLPSIAVIIPVHNESETIAATLQSIQLSLISARELLADTPRVIVGLDGCTDLSASEARKMGAEVVEFKTCQGKWKVLRSLVRRCAECEWVVFADAGIQWPANFLKSLYPHLKDPSVMAIAPSYENAAAGVLEKIHWNIERWLKSLETRSGGPVSVHGATVFYRSDALRTAFSQLGTKHWLNDDVVIPLTLRGLFPERTIVYRSDVRVSEARRKSSAGPEFNRRKRMLMGNLEWVRALWCPLWRQNSVAAVVATRRIFRILWAYWFALLGIAIVGIAPVFSHLFISFGLLTIGVLGLSLPPIRRLLAGAIASMAAPFYYFSNVLLVSSEMTKRLQWK